MMPQNQTRLDKDGKTSDERQQTTKRVENVTHIAEPRSERTRGHSSTKGAEASSQSLISASQQYENMPQAHRRYSNDKEYRDSKLMMVHEEPEESTESVNDYRPQSIDISEVSFMSHSALQEVPVNIREMDSSDNQKVKRPSNIGRRPRVSSTDHNTDEVLSQYHSIDENKDLNAPGTNNATTGEEKPRRSIQRPKSLPPETPVRTSSLPRNARTSLELDQEERLRDSDHQELLNEPIVSKVTTNMQPLRLVSHMMDKTSIEDESKLEIQAQFQDTEISQKLQQVVYPQEEDVTVQNLTNFLEKREVNLMEGDEVREPEQLELAQISRDKRDNVYEMQLEKNLGGEEIIETLKDAKQQQPKSPENHYSLVEQVIQRSTKTLISTMTIMA